MESLTSVVNTVKNTLSSTLSPTAYDLWIKPISPVCLIDSNLYLHLSSDFQKEIISSKYNKMLSDLFKDVFGFDVYLTFVSQEEIDKGIYPKELKDADEFRPFLDREKVNNTAKRYKEATADESVIKGLIDKKEITFEHTFDNFIVSSSNNLAYSACKAVVKDQNDLSYNPLFIYSKSGLGKTHLLLAIKNAMIVKNPTLNIQYVNSETFGNELIEAIGNKTTAQFHLKYRSIDFLLMDDIQFLAGKTQIQEEFFHTFNKLHQVGKQIVLTSDRPPKDINTLEDRLKTRFEWGLLADISPPEFETKMAIIKRKSAQIDLEIPNNICEYIANNIKDNVRQIEGVIKRIKGYEMMGVKPSIAQTKIFIKDIVSIKQPPEVAVDSIIQEVSQTYGVSESDIKSNKRSAQVTLARQAAIYIIRTITGLTYEEIGNYFSNRDHSTITYSLKKMETLMDKDDRQRNLINDLIKNIKELDSSTI